jgi:hypothetical protein
MATSPLRLIVIVGNGADSTKSELAQQVAKDHPNEVSNAKGFNVSRRELIKGKAVVLLPRDAGDGARLAGVMGNALRFSSWLIKVSQGENTTTTTPAEEKALAAFAKVLTVKSDADVAGVVGQIREELFGKKAMPFVPAPRTSRVIGETTGDIQLAVEDVKKAFQSFGQVRDVKVEPGKCVVTFEDVAGGKAALEAKEVICAGTKLMIGKPASRQAKPIAGAQNNNNGGKDRGRRAASNTTAPPAVYMKIENLPAGVDSQAIKTAYSRFGILVADVNTKSNHAILKFSSPEAVPKVTKEKVTTESGVVLNAAPYQPKGGKKPSTGTAAEMPARAEKRKEPASPRFTIVVEGADPVKCSQEQLEKLFKGFKGMTRLARGRQPDRVFVSYDNAESMHEILNAKGIICGTAQLSIHEEVPRGANARVRAPAENTLVVLGAPSEITTDQLAAAFQAYDAQARVFGGRNGNFNVEFPSKQSRDSVLSKQVKVGNQVLMTEAKFPPIETGVFVKGVTQDQETQLRSVLKSFGEVEAIRYSPSGCRVAVKTEKGVESILAAKVSLNGAPLSIEPLRKQSGRRGQSGN